MAINMATLLGRGVLWRSSSLGNLKPHTRNLASGDSNLRQFYKLKNICPFCPSYQMLPQVALSWVEILDGLVHFFTIVYIGP
jgi:hypothetical protein